MSIDPENPASVMGSKGGLKRTAAQTLARRKNMAKALKTRLKLRRAIIGKRRLDT